MRFVVRSLAGAILATFLASGEAQAGWPDEYRLYEENDYFNRFNPFAEPSDRYYTQGIRFEFYWHERDRDEDFLPGITHSAWCKIICGEDHKDEDAQIDDGFAVGQNMYTPEDITNPAPQPNDRPWGGMLQVSRLARFIYRVESLHAQRQDSLEASLGIVGPASLAGDTQIWWHKVIGDDRPAGWDNQLKNEPVVQLRYETALRWQFGDNADIIPRIRGNVGNALISLEGDLTGRVGWNLSGFGVSTIPAPPPVPPFALAKAGSPQAPARVLAGANLFLRGGIRAVARNIFLDGNTFTSNDIRIRRKTLVPEVAVGTEMNLVSNLWFTVQFIRRGSEFETKSGEGAPKQDFGALTLAWAPRH